jgi:hypothetical protein
MGSENTRQLPPRWLAIFCESKDVHREPADQ